MRALLIAAFLLTLAAPAPASAHHSSAMAYDKAKTTVIDGVFADLAWSNPHIELAVREKNRADWRFETRPPGFFVSQGISKTDLEGFVGQKVRVTMHPARNGARRGWLLKMTFEDGAELTLPGD